MQTGRGPQIKNKADTIVRSSDITAAIFLSWAFALAFSIVPMFLSVGIFRAAGEEVVGNYSDGLFIGWIIMTFPTIVTYNALGYLAARTALNLGAFTYFWCVLQNIFIIGAVHLIVLMSVHGLIQGRDFKDIVFISALVIIQYAIVCGVLGGTFFWLYMLHKYPELRPSKMRSFLVAVTSALTYAVAIIAGWFGVTLVVSFMI